MGGLEVRDWYDSEVGLLERIEGSVRVIRSKGRKNILRHAGRSCLIMLSTFDEMKLRAHFSALESNVTATKLIHDADYIARSLREGSILFEHLPFSRNVE